MRTLTVLLVSCVLVSACSDSESSSSNGLKSNPSDGGPGAENSDGTKSGDKPAGSAHSNTAALDIVINEVAAVGPTEWIELGNKGQAAIDLTDLFITDSDKSTNQPKKSHAVKFPAGTKLQPAEYLLIMTSKNKGSVGPHPKAECLPDGPDTCLYATFGVSATSGEAIHILAPDGAVITSTPIPKSLSADAGGSTTETQCRLPDLTGELTKCAPTPGKPNHAP